MRLTFTIATDSWIVGKALSQLHPQAEYREEGMYQSLDLPSLVMSREQLNIAISQVGLITGSTTAKRAGITVIELEEEPAGDKFAFDDKTWLQFKQWLGSCGEITEESDDYIVVADKKAEHD